MSLEIVKEQIVANIANYKMIIAEQKKYNRSFNFFQMLSTIQNILKILIH